MRASLALAQKVHKHFFIESIVMSRCLEFSMLICLKRLFFYMRIQGGVLQVGRAGMISLFGFSAFEMWVFLGLINGLLNLAPQVSLPNNDNCCSLLILNFITFLFLFLFLVSLLLCYLAIEEQGGDSNSNLITHLQVIHHQPAILFLSTKSGLGLDKQH